MSTTLAGHDQDGLNSQGSSAWSRRGRDASYPTPPAQIPACSIPAPGSSMRLASAIPEVWEKAIPLREVGLGAPARHVRPKFPMKAASHRHPAA
jgi:hypothetical protein